MSAPESFRIPLPEWFQPKSVALWCIETTAKPGVVHAAPEGTVEALCQTTPNTHWRTPPKKLRGQRACKNCLYLILRDGRPMPELFVAMILS